jgi:hypothetical protein
MRQPMRFPSSVRRDQAVAAWFDRHTDALGVIARKWFEVMRDCGDDVTELLHDGQPTACIDDAAFGYVDALTDHINVGFFCGTALPDPAKLLQGTGKYMRHVKLRPDQPVNAAALRDLIHAASEDMRLRSNSNHE